MITQTIEHLISDLECNCDPIVATWMDASTERHVSFSTPSGCRGVCSGTDDHMTEEQVPGSEAVLRRNTLL